MLDGETVPCWRLELGLPFDTIINLQAKLQSLLIFLCYSVGCAFTWLTSNLAKQTRSLVACDVFDDIFDDDEAEAEAAFGA